MSVPGAWPQVADFKQSDLEMVRSGAYSILADCEDRNDHDALRTAPVFRLVVERPPDDTTRLV